MQFNLFKQQLLDDQLRYLWDRWARLGAGGYSELSSSSEIDDPEALLLYSLFLGRWDARLFDQIIAWLLINASLINVKRLEGMLSLYPTICGQVLSGVAGKLVSSDVRWKRFVVSDSLVSEDLFFMGISSPLPLAHAEDIDGDFASAGLLRTRFVDRQLATAFRPDEPSGTVLKLRCLLGMNAHAEVLSYLANGRSAHASEIARQLGYSQRAIQEVLTQMERGGGVRVRTQGRKKVFRLNELCWSGLLPKEHKWTDSFFRFAFLAKVWSSIFRIDEENTPSPMIASKLRVITADLDSHFPAYVAAELSKLKGDSYLKPWCDWVESVRDGGLDLG